MKTIVNSLWFRLAGSAAVASVVVIAVVGSAVRYYAPVHEDRAISTLQEVDVISLADNPALAAAIRKERELHGDIHPENEAPPPPPPRPTRDISGFVHVEYTINPDGSISDVKVLGAAPAGVYEEQAIAQVSRQMRAPVFNDAGVAVSRRTTEIIDFSVRADQLPQN